MTLSHDISPLRIGFGDSLRSAIGVLIPVYLLLSASLVGLSELLRIPVMLTAPAILTVAVFVLIAVEILRRYVLTTRAAGRGRTATSVLRATIWAIVVGAAPIAAFTGIGVLTHCFGGDCSGLNRIFLLVMFVWSVVALCTVPLGYQLLRRADWLRSRSASE